MNEIEWPDSLSRSDAALQGWHVITASSHRAHHRLAVLLGDKLSRSYYNAGDAGDRNIYYLIPADQVVRVVEIPSVTVRSRWPTLLRKRMLRAGHQVVRGD